MFGFAGNGRESQDKGNKRKEREGEKEQCCDVRGILSFHRPRLRCLPLRG